MRWEYKAIQFINKGRYSQADLNRLGIDGWELVAIDSQGTFWLKRPLKSKETTPESR